MKPKFLNVGGGSKAVAIPSYYSAFEHLLLDIDPRGNPDIVCDARLLATRPADEFDAIYCSHNLEHYYRHDVPRVLSGFHHVLKADGFAEIRVPDLQLLMATVVEKKLDIDDILYKSGMGPIAVRDVIYGYGREIEQSGQDFYAHKTGFSHKSLTKVLLASGFKFVLSGGGRGYEIVAYAFKGKPTPAHEKLLGFSVQALEKKAAAAAT